MLKQNQITSLYKFVIAPVKGFRMVKSWPTKYIIQ